MRIPAGELSKRITFQRPVETRSDSGAVIQVWQNVATVWSGIKDKGSAESVNSDQTVANKTVTVVIRHLAGINPKWRIVCGNRILNIVSITNSEENRKGHLLTCTEVLA